MSSRGADFASRIDPVTLACAFHGNGQKTKRHQGIRLLIRRPLPLFEINQLDHQVAERITAGHLVGLDQSSLRWKHSALGAIGWLSANRLTTGPFVAIAGLHGLAKVGEVGMHRMVIATFVNYQYHRLGRVSIATIGRYQSNLIEANPDVELSVIKYGAGLPGCSIDDCDSVLVGAALVGLLEHLWELWLKTPDASKADTYDLRIVEDLSWAHARPRLLKAIEIAKAFFLAGHPKSSDKICISDIGAAWILAHKRIDGKELLEDALPKEPIKKVKTTFQAPVSNSNISIDSSEVKQKVESIGLDPQLTAKLAEVVEFVESERSGLDLADDEVAQLDEALEVVQLARTQEVDRSKLVKALITVRTVCSQLAVGVAGNAIFSAAIAIANS